MALGTGKQYLHSHVAAWNKEIDWNSDDIRIMHTSATEVPDQDNDDYYDDIVANEITGTNVPANGTALANPTVTKTGATNVIKFDCDDYSIATATATGIKNSHIYNRTPATDAIRPLIQFIVWDSLLSPNAGQLAVVFDSAGVQTITPAA